MIDIDFNKSDNVLTFHFKGRLDTEKSQEISGLTIEKIRDFSELKSENPFKIVFDIKEVDYIASAFIRICIIAAKSVEKGNFELINSTPMIKKIFKIAGLADVLKVS